LKFNLERADSQEFARWWVVYRNANEDFSQQYSEQYHDIEHVPFCYWIMLEGRRVGGIINVENNFGDFFLIPPFTDAYAILRSILPSEGTVNARGILSEHVPIFQMLGFQVMESRRWMIRPTQAYDVSFSYRRKVPQPEEAGNIANLMYAAFKGGAGQYGRRDVAQHRQSVDDYFEHIKIGDVCHQASSVLYDSEKMVAACLIQTYKALVTIRFVVTHPDYQRQGIARQLIEFGMNSVRESYDHITLAVTVGNAAESLYYGMGFQPGVFLSDLQRG